MIVERVLRPPALVPGHYRKRDTRGVLTAVVDVLKRRHHAGVRSDGLTGVGVAVEAGEIAAGDLEPYPMPFLEQVAGGPQVDGVLVDLVRLDWLRRLARMAVASAYDAICQVSRVAVRSHVYQLCGEVSVSGRGGGV